MTLWSWSGEPYSSALANARHPRRSDSRCHVVRTMSEADISKRIVDALNDLPHCHAAKRWTGGVYSTVGEADVTGCIEGLRFEIETKVPGEDARKVQKARLAAWARAGAITGAARTVDEAKKVVLDGLAARREAQCLTVSR